MNALVRKEIRLLAPSWVLAALFALVQAITRPYDFYITALMFFGMTVMALTMFGRESSLNTFSAMLAQPGERLRLWQTKLSVLAVGFLLVFGIWLIAYLIAYFHTSTLGPMNLDSDDAENSYNLLVTICLIAISTFTGGLWATLLLRQIAGAFWLSLLVPATLCGAATAYLAVNQSDEFIITALCIVLGIYSIGGFFFARWLFFRAQDIGWTGGNISLPESRFFSALFESAETTRQRKPFSALLKKEFQLQKASLTGGVVLLVLHTGVIVLRTHHQFAKNSAGEILVSIFWMLWLILPVMVGSMAIAEERRLGLMDTQACLPVSPRLHFAIKGSLVFLLGTLLGGILPMLLEYTGVTISNQVPVFVSNHSAFFWFQLLIIGLSAWLTFISFFGSSLAKNFLQAIGFAIVATIVCSIPLSLPGRQQLFFFDSNLASSILSLLIGVPAIIVALAVLAYANYKYFRDGWPLWRRNLIGFVGAILFIMLASTAVYDRIWEVFEPAEPPHGAPVFSLANPPRIRGGGDDMQVHLPDGRIWVCRLTDAYQTRSDFWRTLHDPIPKSFEQQFIIGSNWLSALTIPDYFAGGTGDGFMAVGIQRDGSLWFSTNSLFQGKSGQIRLGNDTNWQQVAHSPAGVLLLKNDGSLWRFENIPDWYNWRELATRKLIPVEAGTHWQKLSHHWPGYAQKSDNTVWLVELGHDKHVEYQRLERQTNLEATVSFNFDSDPEAYTDPDGKLWVGGYWSKVEMRGTLSFQVLQVGKATNWLAAAKNGTSLIALRSDGSLWQWNFENNSVETSVNSTPQRLGAHNDWVAVAKAPSSGMLALAADGTFWLWPDQDYYFHRPLLKSPKQPQKIANLFDSK